MDDTSILFFFVILFSSGMSSATTYESTFSGHMCDMDQCVEKTSLSIRNFGRRFYRCQHWSPISITWFFWFVFLIIIMKTVIAFIYYIHSLAPCKTFIVSFNVVCRTPIRHVSSSNGWTRTHAHVAMQQHHLSMKGLQDIKPRQRLQEMKGMRLMQWKQ